MAQLYNAKNSTAHVVPTSGSFLTELMSGDWGLCRAYVEFYSDEKGTIVATPTAGTVVQRVVRNAVWRTAGKFLNRLF